MFFFVWGGGDWVQADLHLGLINISGRSLISGDLLSFVRKKDSDGGAEMHK